jgi:hypothetical protein
MTPAQEALTQQWRAATATPMAVWSGQPKPGSGRNIVTHGRDRDRPQQITRARRG